MAPRLVTDRMLELFPQQGRSKGKHVSESIHRIMQRLHPERFGDGPIDLTLANLGNALERVIIEGLMEAEPDRYIRPGQLYYDGLYGTPDLWDLKDWATVEVKLTWATAGRADNIEDVWFQRYWWQLHAYSKMAGMNKEKLIIVFINGTWMSGRPGRPVGMMWENEPPQEDIDETWAMIKAYS